MSASAGQTPHIVFRLGHMGDVALTTGVLSYWHETQRMTFIFVTREGNAPLLENHPAVADVTGLSPEQLKDWFSTAGKLAKQFRNHTLIDLHSVLRSRILSFRWKGPVKRYPKFGITRRLYDRTRSDVFRSKLESTTVPQRYAMAVSAATPRADELVPRIYLAPSERKQAGDRLSSRAHWLRLAELLEAAGMDWFMVGRNDSPLKDDGRDLTNATGLRETCALLAEADLLVTGDSGPMHLACGVGTPVAAIFGPTVKAWGFYPAGKNDKVIAQPLDCRPCSLHGAKPCPRGFECMTGITPESVLDEIRRMLG